MSADLIEMWHRRTRPHPSDKDFTVQLGCHFEEVCEMLETLETEDPNVRNNLASAHLMMLRVADALKGGADIHVSDRKEFLDACADQVVTAIGAAYCAGMQPVEAIRRVNTSNWSKFDNDGKPIRDENGKIKKGPNYKPPVLDGLY